MTGGAKPTGFTATSLMPLAADPPLVSFNISRGSSSWPTVTRAEYLSVHLLATTQQEIATVFATSDIDRFAATTTWHRGPHGLPTLDDALATLVIRSRTRIDAGDHTLVVADVVLASHTDAQPLLYHRGQYASPTTIS